jgi:hypothetical protein
MIDEEQVVALANLNPQKSDPTALTTRMVLREVVILDDKIENLDSKLDSKIEYTVSSIRREQAALKELLESKLLDFKVVEEGKFKSIKTQLELVERQRIEQKQDTKDAVDAALIYQKEALRDQTIASGLSTSKSDTATEKRLEQLNVTMNTAFLSSQKSITEMKDNFGISISDLRDRIGRMESTKVGATEQKASIRDNLGMVQTLGGIVIVIMTVIATLASTGAFE